MKNKKIDAVALKRRLQKESEQTLTRLSEKAQLELLRNKFGYFIKPKPKAMAGV